MEKFTYSVGTEPVLNKGDIVTMKLKKDHNLHNTTVVGIFLGNINLSSNYRLLRLIKPECIVDNISFL